MVLRQQPSLLSSGSNKSTQILAGIKGLISPHCSGFGLLKCALFMALPGI
jgi:hypothetical protein